MKIACIGWGSLIWRPEGLKIHNHWFEDGPILPIEFTRISSDKRVTLIIDKESKPVRALWALMTCTSIEEAKESLKQREGIKNDDLIHSTDQSKDDSSDEVLRTIKDWLREKNIDRAIWTGLSYSTATKKLRPTINDILEHLKNLNANERIHAEEYIRKAPNQIDTEYRRQIEIEFRWTQGEWPIHSI